MLTPTKRTFLYISLILPLSFLFSGCDENPGVKDRIDMISSLKPKDPYLEIFYNYLKAHDMVEALVLYEDGLMRENKLENTSVEACKAYFRSLSKMSYPQLGERCVPLDSINTEKLHRIAGLMDTPEYKSYVKAAGKKMENTSLAFSLIRIAYLTGGTDFLAMVNHILEQDELNEETKYYYLFYQMPWKRCN